MFVIVATGESQTYDDQKLAAAQHHCFASEDAGVLSSQVLFSVYVHAQPDFEFSKDSIFHGHMIRSRMQVNQPDRIHSNHRPALAGL